MSTFVVPVAPIEVITPHPDADALELAQVLGWQVVVKKHEYQVGDKIVYFPIDTVLPLETSERFGVTKYLSKQRIRCARLRGEPSFGLFVRPLIERIHPKVGRVIQKYVSDSYLFGKNTDYTDR
jgi:RNA ligase (TIGR02306 family)